MIYYIDSVIGNDSNPGTGTTASLAWKSINKINTYIYSLQNNDTILFNRGQTFEGNLYLEYNLPTGITIDAYGSGAKPILSAFETVTGWTSVGNGIYSAPVTISGATTLNLMTINGVSYSKGRYPKLTDPNGGYLKISALATKRITCNLSGNTNYIGGTLVARTQHWLLDTATITAMSAITVSSSTITYNSITNTPQIGYGAFIQNHINTITQFGEWAYSASTKTVYAHFGGNHPSGYTVQVPKYKEAMWINNNYVTVKNLAMTGGNARGYASSIDPQYGLSVTDCDFYQTYSGIECGGSTDMLVQNNTVNDCYNSGINLGYHNPNATVLNNTVQNIGLVPGMGEIYTAINTSDALIGMTCKNNIVKNVGYNGISFNGSGNTVQYNYIENVCMILDDGAAIYNISTPPNFVDHNIVVNSYGNNFGTDQTGFPYAHGIYFDNGTSGFTVTNNVIINASNTGLFYHGAFSAYASGNTIFNSGIGIWLCNDPQVPQITNCTLVNNQIASTNNNQVGLRFTSTIASGDNTLLIGSMDYNYYSNPLNDKSTVYRNNAQNEWFYTLNDWKRSYVGGKFDYNSYGTPPNVINSGTTVLYNTTSATTIVSLSGKTYCDFSGKRYTDSISLQGYSGQLLFQISAPVAAVMVSGRLVKINK